MADADSNSTLRKTPLFATHQRLNARLIEFGGWLMPVHYSSIIEEHRAVRKAAGLFDLSHMSEIEISGPKALEFLQYVTTNDVSKLEVWQAHYTFMLYPDLGIVDDLIIYRQPDKYLLVGNASNIEKDFRWLEESQTISGFDAFIRNRSDATALISIQGPLAAEILQTLVDIQLSDIAYYHCAQGKLGDIGMLIARTGYTGEDGFELFFPKAYAAKVWEQLEEAGQPKGLLPIGLGARDTLRLEAKMALYGNDIDATTNPIEAGLGWAVKFDKGDFCGRSNLLKIKEKGPKRKLVGFEMLDKPIARHGYAVVQDDKTIGKVTSGAPSPTLGKNIGLAYVPAAMSAIDTPLQIKIRDKVEDAKVVKTPFYTRADKQKKGD